MAGLQRKYQPFCFCLEMPNFSFPPLPPFLNGTGQRILQTAIDSRKIPTHPQLGWRGTIQICHLSFPKIVLPFSPFPGGVENTCGQFSRKLFSQIEKLSADYDQDTRVL